MLVTLGCYGFVYTNAIARGFAPAEMLTLAGVTLLLGRRPVLAGAMLGAACGCNYLAVFVAAAAVVSARAWRRGAGFGAVSGAGCVVFRRAARRRGRTSFRRSRWGRVCCGWRNTRWRRCSAGCRCMSRAGCGWRSGRRSAWRLPAWRRGSSAKRPWAGGSGLRLVLAAAAAPPVGLLMLGAVFDNTPIELRYLSFGSAVYRAAGCVSG